MHAHTEAYLWPYIKYILQFIIMAKIENDQLMFYNNPLYQISYKSA